MAAVELVQHPAARPPHLYPSGYRPTCAENWFSAATSTWFGRSSLDWKNILLRRKPKSPLQLAPSRPGRGALAIVTNVGAGCGGRGSVGRVVVFAGRASVREPTQRADDWRWSVRQSRVVLAPVAGVKPAEEKSTQPGFGNPSIRRRRRQEEFVSGESSV